MSPTKRGVVPPDPKVASRLGTLLRYHGISQAELAKRIRVTPAAVSQWISGKTALSPANAKRIAATLGEDVDFVMGRVDKATKGYGALLASLDRIMGGDLARELEPVVANEPELILEALRSAVSKSKAKSDDKSGS